MTTYKRNKNRKANNVKYIHGTAQAVRADEMELSPVASWQLAVDNYSTGGTKSLLPEWYPCLCNGGWDPCPVCYCGLKDEPPCILCGGSPVEGEAFYRAWQAQELDDAYAKAAQAADQAASWEERDEDSEAITKEDCDHAIISFEAYMKRRTQVKDVSEAPDAIREAAYWAAIEGGD